MVITDVNQVVYQGDGVTTAFPFTFRIIDATDVKLLLIDADGSETDITSDYFVDTVNNTVHYPGYAPGAEPPEADRPAPVQTGQRLVVYRELPITQEKDLGEKWPFFVTELALDKLTMLIQQVKGIWDRCLKVSVGQEATALDFNYTVPIEAGKTFRVKDDGTGFELTEDPAVAHTAAVAAQEAAESAQGLAEDAKDAAEAAAALTELQAVWFDNVAALRAADIPVGMTAGTKGYHVVNDGGNAVYTIRTKTQSDVEDGGSIIFLGNGNVAKLITDGTVNVKQFGAKGDGTTDDTIAIHSALIFGTRIYLPYGIYKITIIDVSISSKHIYCDGIIIASAETAINVVGSDNLFSLNISFNDGSGLVVTGDNNKIINSVIHRTTKLDGVTSKNYQKACIKVLGKNNTIQNNEVYNAYNGIACKDAENTLVVCNNIHDCMTGIQVTGTSQNITIDANHIYDIDILEYSGSDGILVKDGIYRVTITDNIIDNVAEHGMYIQSAYTIISNNNISNAKDHAGIKLASYEDTIVGYRNENSVVENNVIDGCTNGIVLQNVNVNTIINENSILNCSNRAISSASVIGQNYENSSNLTIALNNCVDGTIYIQSKSNLVVDGNQARKITVVTYDNPDYTYPIIVNNVVDTLELGFAVNGIARGNSANEIYVFHGMWKIDGNIVKQQSQNISLAYITEFTNNYVTGSGIIMTTPNITELKLMSNNRFIISGSLSSPFVDTRSSNAPSEMIITGNSFDIGTNTVKSIYLYGDKHIVCNNIFKSGNSSPITVQGGSSVNDNNVIVV